MSTFKNIFKVGVISIGLLLGAQSAAAHSDHDHSMVPFKWEFSSDIKNKIDRSLVRPVSKGMIGLSKFEQKKLGHYGIEVGNTFRSMIDGNTLTVERTTTGLQILDVSPLARTSNEMTYPVHALAETVRTSASPSNHSGHDHSVLRVNWMFGKESHDIIFHRLHETHHRAFIGLSSFEQKMMEEYGIKAGNRLLTRILGMPFTMERTLSGVVVYQNDVQGDVAQFPMNSGERVRF